MTNVAVLEKGWIGGGNTGRNTTIVRSNYSLPCERRGSMTSQLRQSTRACRASSNFNVMLSSARRADAGAQPRHELDKSRAGANAMRRNGIDCQMLDRDGKSPGCRADRSNSRPHQRAFPILGGYHARRRAGPARHDAVAWGYARAASALGIDIVQNCKVTGFVFSQGRVIGVRTSRGEIRADRIGAAVAGHSSRIAEMAGFRLPITSFALQAMVSEPVKPVLNTVTLSPAVGTYWSQSDKGEVVIGGGLDHFPSYAQKGSFAVTQQVLAATLEMFPSFSQPAADAQWGGIVDVVRRFQPDHRPTPAPGLYLNCGWGTGGFKAIPAGGWTAGPPDGDGASSHDRPPRSAWSASPPAR
jgi:sarcosine oxidase subunit beta